MASSLYAMVTISACTLNFDTFDPTASTAASSQTPPMEYGDDTIDTAFPIPDAFFPTYDGGSLFDNYIPPADQYTPPTDTAPPPDTNCTQLGSA
jgi:hypothetical protein